MTAAIVVRFFCKKQAIHTLSKRDWDALREEFKSIWFLGPTPLPDNFICSQIDLERKRKGACRVKLTFEWWNKIYTVAPCIYSAYCVESVHVNYLGEIVLNDSLCLRNWLSVRLKEFKRFKTIRLSDYEFDWIWLFCRLKITLALLDMLLLKKL